jgi:hypothetical protein
MLCAIRLDHRSVITCASIGSTVISMRCLYCGKPLPKRKALTGGGEFCSDVHRHNYQEEYNKLALLKIAGFPVGQPQEPSMDSPVVQPQPGVPKRIPEKRLRRVDWALESVALLGMAQGRRAEFLGDIEERSFSMPPVAAKIMRRRAMVSLLVLRLFELARRARQATGRS